MATSLDPQAEKLRRIQSIPALVTYLHVELGWPVDVDDWEDAVYDWQPQELNLKPEHAVAISSIKQLRPLVTGHGGVRHGGAHAERARSEASPK